MFDIYAGALSKRAVGNDPYNLVAAWIYVADSRIKHQYYPQFDNLLLPQQWKRGATLK